MAIADRSGATPETTDDGVLWLDLSGERLPNFGACTIPVTKDRDKGDAWVPVTRKTLLDLTVRYWGAVECGGDTYTVRKG